MVSNTRPNVTYRFTIVNFMKVGYTNTFYQKKLSLVHLTHGSKTGRRFLRATDLPLVQLPHSVSHR